MFTSFTSGMPFTSPPTESGDGFATAAVPTAVLAKVPFRSAELRSEDRSWPEGSPTTEEEEEEEEAIERAYRRED